MKAAWDHNKIITETEPKIQGCKGIYNVYVYSIIVLQLHN